MSFSVPSPVATMSGESAMVTGRIGTRCRPSVPLPSHDPGESSTQISTDEGLTPSNSMKNLTSAAPVVAVTPATVSFDTVNRAVVVFVTAFTPSPPVFGSTAPKVAESSTKSRTPAPTPATTKLVLTAKVTSNELKVVVPPGETVLGEPSPDTGSGKVEYWLVSGLKHANVCVTSSAPASVSLNNTIVNPDAKARSAARSTDIRRRMETLPLSFRWLEGG